MGIGRMLMNVVLFGCGVAAYAQTTAQPASLDAFRRGEAFLAQNNYQSAANEFREALNGDRSPSWVIVWSRVHLGRIFERTGQPERAVTEYQAAVRTGDNTGGALDEAIQFLRKTGHEIPRPHPPPATPPIPGFVPVQPVERTPSPEYTDEARLAELEGTVWITATIGTDGRARDPQVTRSLGLGLDEKAMDVIRKWRFWPALYGEIESETKSAIPVDFVVPSKLSRWHLLRVTFRLPEGASRPVFRSVSYPPGAGLSRNSLDHAQVIVAIGRQASAIVSFRIDEEGRPVDFKVDSASEDRWGPEAISIVQSWRFTPGMKDGKAVSVLCTLTLVWGQKNMSAEMLREIAHRVQH